jgi:DNA topoisomerase IA
VRVLMVAEKPSIAKTITEILSNGKVCERIKWNFLQSCFSFLAEKERVLRFQYMSLMVTFNKKRHSFE